MPLRRCQEILLEFGLTPNQARVYLAAVQLGIAPVSQVSEACGVRREDTYRALAKLQGIGLVQRIMNKPSQVKVLPVEEALTILIKNWKESASKKELMLAERKQEFLKYFKTVKIQPIKKESHYELILEKDAVFTRIKDMLETTETKIDAVSSAEEIAKIIPVLSENLLKPRDNQIKVRLILEKPEEKKTLQTGLRKYMSHSFTVEVKYAYKQLSHFAIVDFGNVLFATSREPSIGKLPYLWTDTLDFVKLLERHFEEIWQASRGIETAQTTAT